MTRVRGPIRTGPSITTYGPMSAVGSISARRSMTAVGWIGTYERPRGGSSSGGSVSSDTGSPGMR